MRLNQPAQTDGADQRSTPADNVRWRQMIDTRIEVLGVEAELLV
jgi:hypothetical protein